MAVTDLQAVKFTNEQIRPLCEAARALKVAVDAAGVDWFAGVNGLFPNDGTVVFDNAGTAPRHDTEGVAVLTGADIHNVMAQLLAKVADLNETIVSKPCVRPLEVTVRG